MPTKKVPTHSSTLKLKRNQGIEILSSFACFHLTWPRIFWHESALSYYFDSQIICCNEQTKIMWKRLISHDWTSFENVCLWNGRRWGKQRMRWDQRSWHLSCNYKECSISMRRLLMWTVCVCVLCVWNFKCNKKSRPSCHIARQIHLESSITTNSEDIEVSNYWYLNGWNNLQ